MGTGMCLCRRLRLSSTLGTSILVSICYEIVALAGPGSSTSWMTNAHYKI